MKLKLAERITLMGMFPEQNSFENLILKKDLMNKIEVTQQEVTDYEIRTENNSIKWNASGITSELEISFTQAEKNYLKSIVEKLSKEEKIPDIMFDFCLEILDKK